MSSVIGPAFSSEDAHPPLDFLEMKRLDHVVVGAGAQTVYLVFPAVARRKNQDRIGMSVRTNLLDDVDARDFGQSEVNNGEIDRVFARVVQPFLAVGALLDGKTLIFQPLRQ